MTGTPPLVGTRPAPHMRTRAGARGRSHHTVPERNRGRGSRSAGTLHTVLLLAATCVAINSCTREVAPRPDGAPGSATSAPVYSGYPDWSPDGASIAYFAEVDGDKASLNWRHFVSVQDVRNAELFLDRWMFYLRFARKGLGLNDKLIQQFLEMNGVPVKNEDVDLFTWTIMAYAHYILFKEISCKPLSEAAAKSFLEIVFLPEVFKDEVKQCDDALVYSFHQELLKLPIYFFYEIQLLDTQIQMDQFF